LRIDRKIFEARTKTLRPNMAANPTAAARTDVMGSNVSGPI
jgi:hypothetical protein